MIRHRASTGPKLNGLGYTIHETSTGHKYKAYYHKGKESEPAVPYFDKSVFYKETFSNGFSQTYSLKEDRELLRTLESYRVPTSRDLVRADRKALHSHWNEQYLKLLEETQCDET